MALTYFNGFSVNGGRLLAAAIQKQAMCMQSQLQGSKRQRYLSYERLPGCAGSGGGKAKAHRLLSEIYNWFSEGFDISDLHEARTFLKELAPAQVRENGCSTITYNRAHVVDITAYMAAPYLPINWYLTRFGC
jgi:hypothetical protein